MTSDEQFAYMKTTVLDRVTTWDDMYCFFDEVVAKAREEPSLLMLANAMFVMYAFLTAMRESPDEGDIKKLAERTFRIMIYEGKEKLGATFSVVTAEELIAEVGKKITRDFLGGLVDESAIARAEAEKPKGPLH